MRLRRSALMLAIVWCAMCAVPKIVFGQNPQQQGTGTSTSGAADEPEEPDFAFVSGSGYTQVKKSVQSIHQTGFGTRRFNTASGKLNQDDFLFFQRLEYGITDWWELDIVFPAAGNRTRLNGTTTSSEYAFADSIVGVRYRLLREGKAPFTLTMGPQVIFPSGSVSKGTGTGSAGFAWDVALSKDWGGPVFMYNTLNYRVLPSAKDPTAGSTHRLALHGATWATALGLRLMEKEKNGSNSDIHGFLEGSANWNQQVNPGTTLGTRDSELAWQVAPGIRYGYSTQRKMLTEIGVTFPIGLGPHGPKWGVVVQFQFEILFEQPKKP
ncbi:MAG: hypothetical protein HY046_07845 [Acidobacteria bacterium]|nr:hypothetical protein [Acidobacteriota bacterium]